MVGIHFLCKSASDFKTGTLRNSLLDFPEFVFMTFCEPIFWNFKISIFFNALFGHALLQERKWLKYFLYNSFEVKYKFVP